MEGKNVDSLRTVGRNWQAETMVQIKPDLQMRALLLGVKCVYTNTHTHSKIKQKEKKAEEF